MRSLLIIASALFAFGAAITFEPTAAHAVVCADGVVRAGCACYTTADEVERLIAGVGDIAGK